MSYWLSADFLNVIRIPQCQYLTLMSLELHVRTDGDLYPNPRLNPICAIFYHVTVDAPSKGGETEITGILVIEETTSGSTIGGVQLPHGTQKSQDSPTCRDSSNEPYFWKYLQVFQEAKVTFVRDEFSLIQELIKVVHL